MPPKKKPLLLHVSLARIELERVNVAKRTETRIAQLLTKSLSCKLEDDVVDEPKVEDVEWHRCLNAFCFCVLLLTLNLLFVQWVYLQVHVGEPEWGGRSSAGAV